MKSPTTLLLLSLFTIVLLSCGGSDDSPTEPEVIVDPDPIPGQTSTYTAHVKTIIDSNCIECHGDPLDQGAIMMLLTYDQVVDAVNNRGLFNRIATMGINSVMPPLEEGGRLPQVTIDIVEDWIADGLLEQ
ncbi:hypothetical protein [uncultured Aquimarina sp.]|uniref:hypothetical protein n=1 Tax=uncultured Aquimarina sp. TaxID=575652 RepID=UPI0026294824|nr:hypothetical protein [uncultured Aquimarina sp.]